MKRRLVAVAALLALLTVASACSSPGPPVPASSDTIAAKLTLGGPAEFQTRPDGVPGLTRTYGVTFGRFQVTDTSGPLTVEALRTGQVDAADLFTTDPAIAADNFVVLTDPKSTFPAQNIVPIVNQRKATAGVTATLNAISAKLDTAGLSALVARVVTDKANPADVAKDWLAANGLDQPTTPINGDPLTVGSADFPENVLLATLYATALRIQGAQVVTNFGIGSREQYFPELQNGSIDVIPEYTGNALAYLDKSSSAAAPDEVYASLVKALPQNLRALQRSSAQDSDAIVVTRATADKYHLTSIGDLAKTP